MKNLKGLKDVKVLSKMEQKTIAGGLACNTTENDSCPSGICCNGRCREPEECYKW